MGKETASNKEGERPIRRVRTKTFAVKHTGALNAADARKAIAEVIRTIPDSQLSKFRAGAVMLVM
jgi:hypothetical protein